MTVPSRWGHLSSRVLPWLFLPALLILVAAALITLIAYERSLVAEAIDHERESAYLSANRFSEEMARFSDVLTSLSRTVALYRQHPAGQRSVLRAARRRVAIFDGGVVLLDNFGKVVGSQPPRLQISGQDWSSRPYFMQLLSGQTVAFSDTLDDGPGGGSVVVVAVPVTSPQGEFLGALAGMFRLGEPTVSPFYASLVRLRIGQGAYLVDDTGRVIYHPEPDRIGQDLSADPMVARALAGQVGAFRVSYPQNAVVATAHVPGTPWTLVTEREWTALISPSRGYERFLILLLVMGILIPGAWFGLLNRQRRAEAMERAYLEHQLQVARLVQQTLLPKENPKLPGWQMSGHYQPAHAVGGDFYDYLYFEDGQVGLLIGDVTDKGVPAALLMATTRSLLRSVAQRMIAPGQVLRQVNDLLVGEIPPKMFVTCLYAILDPATGRLRYANAGHNLPYRAHPGNGQVAELRATGMPLGLMPRMNYEEKETTIAPGEYIVFYSDGLVEAHNPQREMFGNPRLQNLLSNYAGDGPTLIQCLLAELDTFTGRGWQQEDDVTLVTLQRTGSGDLGPAEVVTSPTEAGWRSLAHISLPSEPGSERQAIQQVVEAVRELGLPTSRLDSLQTAVGEATMNAIEHGNRGQPDQQVRIQVLASEDAVMVRITDQGSGPPVGEPQPPDLEAKLAGRQSPRGWGLFLIENMVDHTNVVRGDGYSTLELVLLREGGKDGNPPA